MPAGLGPEIHGLHPFDLKLAGSGGRFLISAQTSASRLVSFDLRQWQLSEPELPDIAPRIKNPTTTPTAISIISIGAVPQVRVRVLGLASWSRSRGRAGRSRRFRYHRHTSGRGGYRWCRC